MQQSRNPYEVLRIGTTSAIGDVIERSKELAEETMDKGKLDALRKAVEEIRQHPVRRARNQFWEPPHTVYDDPVIEQCCDQYRRSPLSQKELEQRAAQFVTEECSPPALIHLALPPIERPDKDEGIGFSGVPTSPVQLPLELWELFT